MNRLALWVVVLSLCACSGKSGNEPGGPNPATDGGGTGSGNGSIPAALAGDWRWGSVSTVDYYDPDANTFTTPEGVGAALRLNANATYEQAGYLQSGTTCSTRIFYWKSGTVTVTGSTLVMHPTQSVRRIEDSCDAANPKETRGWAEEETFTWEVIAAATGSATVLRLKAADGSFTDYDRKD